MPFGGNDWLALTQEPALEPELPICDPHHHFWDFRTTRIPYQRYLLHELAGDMRSGHNVRSTVFIEARAMYRADAPEEMRPVGEVEFVQGLAAASASGLYGPGRAAAAIVGHANLLLGDRVAPVLEALHAAAARQAGVREDVADSIRENRALTNLARDEEIAVKFARQVLRNRKVDRATFDAATAQFGQRGVMTLTNLIACYAVLAYNMNTYELEAPDHATEPALPA